MNIVLHKRIVKIMLMSESDWADSTKRETNTF